MSLKDVLNCHGLNFTKLRQWVQQETANRVLGICLLRHLSNLIDYLHKNIVSTTPVGITSIQNYLEC